ncbi:MAG: CPBP family glutamic-type intramembrane protease [Candidatus Thermoplasmatota archaeon]|nr:CPBP family glutamic-type intramembrane protease [Candidatus Thermoplasmatota archaeon]
MDNINQKADELNLIKKIVIVLLEVPVFLSFILFFDFSWLFTFYIYVTPFLLIAIIYLARKRIHVERNFLSKDFFVFLGILFLWLYVYALMKQSTLYVLSIVYYPAFLEELNFRYIIPELLSGKTGMGKAIIIQSVLYMIFYAGLPILKPGSYPGIYEYIFFFDNFVMSIFYGSIYYLRESIYLDVTLHMSFYLIELFLTPATAWIATVLAPV